MDAPAAIRQGCVVDLAGVPTLLRAQDPRVAAALADMLGDCPRRESPVVIRVVDDTAHIALPRVPPTEDYGPVRLWRHDGVLVLSSGRVLTGEADDSSVRLVPGEGSAAQVGRAFRQLLPFALAHVLAAHGRVVLHAGAYLEDGSAVVVLGGTGTGKSTLVYAARQCGRRVVSDDLVVLAVDGEGVDVAGIPRPMAVADADPGDLPVEARPVGEDQRSRWQFPLDGESGWHRAVGVVQVGHSMEPEGAVRDLDPSRTWDLVLGSFPAATDAPRLRGALPALAAVSRLPAWRLEHGSDPRTRLATAGRLLDGIRPSEVRR